MEVDSSQGNKPKRCRSAEKQFHLIKNKSQQTCKWWIDNKAKLLERGRGIDLDSHNLSTPWYALQLLQEYNKFIDLHETDEELKKQLHDEVCKGKCMRKLIH